MPASWPAPVSYTHLDVYKRQRLLGADLSVFPAFMVSDSAAGKSGNRSGSTVLPQLCADNPPSLVVLAGGQRFLVWHRLAASTWMTFYAFKKASLKIVEFLIKRIKIVCLI